MQVNFNINIPLNDEVDLFIIQQLALFQSKHLIFADVSSMLSTRLTVVMLIRRSLCSIFNPKERPTQFLKVKPFAYLANNIVRESSIRIY